VTAIFFPVGRDSSKVADCRDEIPLGKRARLHLTDPASPRYDLEKPELEKL